MSGSRCPRAVAALLMLSQTMMLLSSATPPPPSNDDRRVTKATSCNIPKDLGFCRVAYGVEEASAGGWHSAADRAARESFEARAPGLGPPLCKRLLRDLLCALAFRGRCAGDPGQGGLLREFYGGVQMVRPCISFLGALDAVCGVRESGIEDINFGHRADCFYPTFQPRAQAQCEAAGCGGAEPLSAADYGSLGVAMRKEGRLEDALSFLIEALRRGHEAAAGELYSLGHASLQAYQHASSLHRTFRDRLLGGEGPQAQCAAAKDALLGAGPAGGAMPGPGRKAQIISEYVSEFGARFFVETGTFTGLTLLNVREAFEQMFSFEISETLHRQAKENLAERGVANVELFHGDSKDLLPTFLKSRAASYEGLDFPSYLFFLDAHFSGSDWFTSVGSVDFPLIQELSAIFNMPGDGHVILIDDAASLLNSPHEHLAGRQNDLPAPSLMDLADIVCAFRPDWRMHVRENIVRIHRDVGELAARPEQGETGQQRQGREEQQQQPVANANPARGKRSPPRFS